MGEEWQRFIGAMKVVCCTMKMLANILDWSLGREEAGGRRQEMAKEPASSLVFPSWHEIFWKSAHEYPVTRRWLWIFRGKEGQMRLQILLIYKD